MNLNDFNHSCGNLPATTHVTQWGGADVWKIGGKVFAIGGWNRGEVPGITFKTSPVGFELLREMPGLRPAPYLASRGMSWIQRYALPGPDDAELKEHLARSHELVAAGLSRKLCMELGLNPMPVPRIH